MNHQLTVTKGQPFVLNAAEFNVPVNIAPTGETPHVINNRVGRPEREQLLERERESVTEIKPVSGGRSVIVTNDREANIKLYKKIARGVTGITQDGSESEANQSLLQKMQSGWMNNAIVGLFKASARIRWNPSMAYVDADQNQPLLVDYEIGTGEEPDFVLTFQIRKPDELVMGDFRLNSQKVMTGGGGRRAKSQFITDLVVAERTYKEIFDGVTGAVIALGGGGSEDIKLLPYSAELRDEFIEATSLIIQRDVVQAVMDYLEGNLLD